MRLIDADALVEYFEGLARSLANARCFNGADAIKGAAEKVTAAPTIDAEPVRHGETTSYISTDNIDKYKSCIILDEGDKSKWCRVFYEDDREHGVWVNPHMNKYGHPCHHCSECGFLASQKDRNYCPNCGAMMDAKEEEHATD